MRRPMMGILALVRLLVVLVVPSAIFAASSAGSVTHWAPSARLTWYWQLTGSVNNSHPAAAYDIDGFDTSASEVAALHAAGKRVICYIDVGTWENWRSDAAQFPSSVLGNDNGWAGERWLDIRQRSILEPLMTTRLQMCKQKGFDAVEPDNIDGYENDTGFPISAGQQLAYDEWVAREVHSLGLAVFQKNDPDQASALASYFDGALAEQCSQDSECSSFAPYLSAGKPVLDAEYQASLYPGFCSADNAAGIMGALYGQDLDGAIYRPCWNTSTNGSSGPASAPASSNKRATRLDRTNPSVTISVAALSIKREVAGLKLGCPRGQSYCDGSVTITTVRRFLVGGKRRSQVLGSRHFHLAGAHRSIVEVSLARSGLAKLGKAKSAEVVVAVSARDKAGRRGSSRETVALLLPGAR